MNKRFVLACGLIVILGLIAWRLSRKNEPAGTPGASASGMERNHAAAQADTSRGEDSDTPATNQRTRPSQAPPARVYPKPKPETPVAKAVPGNSGFVFSPFNNKLIDVQNIPPGSLVADPTFPAEEKKYFRVPE